MTEFKNKIDFAAIVEVRNANPNGDPLNGNRPRTDYDGYGEISDVCIKRKIRNRMQDLGYEIFVKSEDRNDDEFKSLSERASTTLDGINNTDEYAKKACEIWLDVRSFGQVFAFKSKKKNKEKENDGISVGVRGPVSIHQAVSLSPVEIEDMQITKSVNGEPAAGKSSDRMGMKHFVKFGVYEIRGSINVQLAEKTGFSVEDAEVIKECMRTLFVNDVSSARPDGSMRVVKLFWWKHDCKDGQYSAGRVHDSVKISLKDGVDTPKTVADYAITTENLPGLEPEVIDGV